jgi:cbb3-type cytochrome oxidase subunit 3
MGFMGDLLGLMINLLAIFILFIAVRGIYRAYKNRNRYNDDQNKRRY